MYLRVLVIHSDTIIHMRQSQSTQTRSRIRDIPVGITVWQFHDHISELLHQCGFSHGHFNRGVSVNCTLNGNAETSLIKYNLRRVSSKHYILLLISYNKSRKHTIFKFPNEITFLQLSHNYIKEI